VRHIFFSLQIFKYYFLNPQQLREFNDFKIFTFYTAVVFSAVLLKKVLFYAALFNLGKLRLPLRSNNNHNRFIYF